MCHSRQRSEYAADGSKIHTTGESGTMKISFDINIANNITKA